MSLINVLSSRISSVYALVKQYALKPVVAGVPIETFRYRVVETAEVSKHVLVDLTALKKFVNDNIAPGPHEWELEGYIGGFPIELVGRTELMPSIRIFHDILEKAYISRGLVPFVDSDQKLWPMVAIENFESEKTFDVENRLLVRLRLREITVLSVTPLANGVEQAAAPAVGGPDGTIAPGAAPAAQLLPPSAPFLSSADTTTGAFLDSLRAGYSP